LTCARESFPEKSDRQIKTDVERQLRWSAFVDERDVSVTVDHGIVTLSGTVGSLAEREAALWIAHKGGAQAVRDRLVLDRPSDNKGAKAVGQS
jgi:osmotically-inducible protein OsmY